MRTEYRPEAEEITLRLPGVDGPDDVARVLRAEFLSFGGSAVPEQSLRRLAIEVWELWQHVASSAD